MRVPYSVFVLLLAILFTWAMVGAVVHGAPPLFILFLLFLFLRRRRWSRRY